VVPEEILLPLLDARSRLQVLQVAELCSLYPRPIPPFFL
jgi:hypothetical protein